MPLPPWPQPSSAWPLLPWDQDASSPLPHEGKSPLPRLVSPPSPPQRPSPLRQSPKSWLNAPPAPSSKLRGPVLNPCNGDRERDLSGTCGSMRAAFSMGPPRKDRAPGGATPPAMPVSQTQCPGLKSPLPPVVNGLCILLLLICSARAAASRAASPIACFSKASCSACRLSASSCRTFSCACASSRASLSSSWFRVAAGTTGTGSGFGFFGGGGS
mmetsp:Transcript_47282/g.133349  ORF Transcript_47282/g.133349 Transcript_47282/m.133349 type:complete len:215 (+) Transcript_47282:512-1156(+)